MSAPISSKPARFFGWQVVWAAFIVAVFGWGVSFYGPPVFLHAIHASRGWSVALVSAAVTLHFLLGAFVVAKLATMHQRYGVVAVTRAAGIATALGFLGWALAEAPWQLFAATLLTGFGWAATGGAAINAMVSPWFVRRRPAALSTAYNGASIGGVLLSPLWVALIAGLGFVGATALVGGVMVVVLWLIAGRYFALTPAALGLAPDGAVPARAPDGAVPARAPGGAVPARAPGGAVSARAPDGAVPDGAVPDGAVPARAPGDAAPLGGSPWRDRRFVTLAAATSLGLFAQIGLIAHLFSLLVPPLGPQLAGLAAALATVCAIAGRTGLGWLLPAEADRRRAAAANYALQVVGSLTLLAAGGGEVTLLLLGVALFGLGLGNTTSLPPLIAQQDFAPAETARIVALVTACSQAAYAFAPAGFGLLREFGTGAEGAAPALFVVAAVTQAAAAAVLLRRGGSGGVP